MLKVKLLTAIVLSLASLPDAFESFNGILILLYAKLAEKANQFSGFPDSYQDFKAQKGILRLLCLSDIRESS